MNLLSAAVVVLVAFAATSVAAAGYNDNDARDAIIKFVRGFARHMRRVWKDTEGTAARPMFFFSILYLFLIFAALLADRVFFLPIF